MTDSDQQNDIGEVGVCEAKILLWLKDYEMNKYSCTFKSRHIEWDYAPWFTASVRVKLRTGLKFVGLLCCFLGVGQFLYAVIYKLILHYYSALFNMLCGSCMLLVAYFMKKRGDLFVRHHQLIMTVTSLVMSLWMYALSALPEDDTVYLWRCSVFHGAVRGIIMAFASLNIQGFVAFTATDELMFLLLMLLLRPHEHVLTLPVTFLSTEFVLAFAFVFFAREIDISARRAFMRDRLRLWHGDHVANQLKTLEADKKTAKKINAKQQIMISYAHVDKDFAKKFVRTLKAQEPEINVWIDDVGMHEAGYIRAGKDWRNEIAEAIKDSVAVVFIMSPASVSSRYCKEEIFYASNCQKPVFCVVKTPAFNDLSGGMKLILARTQWLMPDHYIKSKIEKRRKSMNISHINSAMKAKKMFRAKIDGESHANLWSPTKTMPEDLGADNTISAQEYREEWDLAVLVEQLKDCQVSAASVAVTRKAKEARASVKHRDSLAANSDQNIKRIGHGKSVAEKKDAVDTNNVFICFHPDNSQIAAKLTQGLTKWGFNPRRQMSTDDNLVETDSQNIDNASAVLFVCSTQAVASNCICEILHYVYEEGKPTAVALVDEIEKIEPVLTASIEMMLMQFPAVDMKEHSFSLCSQLLVHALHTIRLHVLLPLDDLCEETKTAKTFSRLSSQGSILNVVEETPTTEAKSASDMIIHTDTAGSSPETAISHEAVADSDIFQKQGVKHAVIQMNTPKQPGGAAHAPQATAASNLQPAPQAQQHHTDLQNLSEAEAIDLEKMQVKRIFI